jgi:hypothetical protein
MRVGGGLLPGMQQHGLISDAFLKLMVIEDSA